MNQVQPKELAQALYGDSSDALFLVDASQSLVVDANESAVRLCGRVVEALTGLSLSQLLLPHRPHQLDELSAALSTKNRFHAPDGFDLRSARNDELIPVELTLRPLGASSFALLEVRDVRQRRLLEERTALAETELSLVLNTVAAAVWCAERGSEGIAPRPGEGLTGWKYRYLSPAVERVTGWPLEFFLDGPQKFAEIIHPDDRTAVLTERTTFLLSPDTYFSMELRLIGKDSQERWVRSDMQATRDAQGRAMRIDGVVTDISRSKVAELSLRESQHWLTRLLETNSNGILILDLTGRISFVNLAAQKLIGRRSEEMLDRDWNELAWRGPEDEGDASLRDLAYRTLSSSELTLERPDGTTAVVSLSAAPLRDDMGRVTGVVVTLFDLSQRKRAEEAIRRSEERYRRLFERNLAGVCRYTLDGKFIDANPAFAHIFGYETPEEMRDIHGQETYFTPEERIAKLEKLVAHGHLSNLETRRRRKDGSEIWVLENVAVVAEGSLQVVEATLVDITERMRAEQTLSREHTLLLSLLYSIPDFIFYKDRDGRYRGCNPAFEQYSGLKETDMVGRTIHELYPRNDAEVMEGEDRQVYATGKPLRLDKVLETGQGQRQVELVLNPLHDNDGRIIGLLGIGRDITERRRLEEQLRQAGKMEAIGRLAGGVAHDFNNLLTIILGNLSLAQTLLAGHDGANDLLADSEQAAQRTAELTNQLLGFARGHPLTMQTINFNRCATETLQLLRRTIDPRVGIDTQFAPNLWPVEADAGQMSQVLVNLCLNARDALREGGQIRIETANVSMSLASVNGNLDARPGDFVRLRLTDDGPGIPAEVRARIFEPFFTTKPFGKGTGLGLAVVFGIIRQHQGWVECHSGDEKGTRFDIYLPRSHKPVAEESPLPEVLPITGSETILLVDDEPMIRELGRAILNKQGYRVLVAEDGAVGVDMYRRHRDEIDLILLDLSMPNMSGKEARVQRCRNLNPRIRVLIASGFSPDQFEPGELEGVLGFISKPYRPHELTRAIRTALDQAPRGGDALIFNADRTPAATS